MGKQIKFDNDAEYYYNRGLDFAENGNNIDAIANFYLALDKDPGNVSALDELAYSYYEMGLINQAIMFYLRLLDADKYSDIPYIGLVQCFVRKGKPQTAFYYINLGLKYGALDNDVVPQVDLDEVEDTPPALGVIDNNDYSGLVEFSKNMCSSVADSQSNDFAKKLLEHVPETSPQYLEARNQIAFMLLKSGNIDECIAETNKILEKDSKSAYAYCTLISAYYEKGDFNKCSELFKALDLLDVVSSREDVVKVAACAADTDNDEMAVKYFGRLFEFIPYEARSTAMYALALYNVGKKDEARRYFAALKKLYPGDGMVSYYALCVNDPDGNERIKIQYNIPKQEYNRRIKYVDDKFSKLSKIEEIVEAIYYDEELFEDVMWLLLSDDQTYSTHIASFLCQSELWQPYILDRLINPDISLVSKRDNLYSYLKYSKVKKFSLVVNDELVFYSPRKPKCADNLMLENAYWSVFSTAAMLNSTFQTKLNKVYKIVVERMHTQKLMRFKPAPEILAAIMTRLSDIGGIFCNKEDCCNIYGISTDKYDEWLNKLDLCKEEEIAVKNFETKLNKQSHKNK